MTSNASDLSRRRFIKISVAGLSPHRSSNGKAGVRAATRRTLNEDLSYAICDSVWVY